MSPDDIAKLETRLSALENLIQSLGDALYNPEAIDVARFKDEANYLYDGEEGRTWTPDTPAEYGMALFYKQRARFFELAFSKMWACKETGYDYYEFGCHTGATFKLALTNAYKFGLSEMEFHAFDSFAGLPSDGSLVTSEEEFLEAISRLDIWRDKVRTYKGWYEATLTPELQADLKNRGSVAGIVNVDCDLHESAVRVFEFIEPLMTNGTVLYLNSYYATFHHGPDKWGIAKAFFDYRARSRFKFEPFHPIGFWGSSFVAYDW